MKFEFVLIIWLSMGTFGVILGNYYYNSSQTDTIVVIPTFTKIAYQDTSSWYYNHTSTHAKAHQWDYSNSLTWSLLGQYTFNGVNQITDVELDANPSILNNYSRVILLHNEYVTFNEYNAIMKHSNVFYAYPNALYKYVSYSDGIVTLLGSTNNPMSQPHTDKVNEYDICMMGHKIIDYPNGKGFNCYPEYTLMLMKGDIFK